MKYRREIDGLRTLAVVPVILFHAGFKTFSGGFVGVDIFFVISGYLITTILLSELQAGRFSIINFYERRARRILPALFAVMAMSLALAWAWLQPSDMKSFSKSLVAVSLFASNIFFWSESGYFSGTAELKPALHTWSLAVEEQFYLFFPIILMLAWRLGRKLAAAIVALIFVASLAAAQWGAHHAPEPTFFLIHSRAWELAVGALLAFYFMARPRPANPLLNQLGSLAGLALIAYGILVFNKHTPFPSFWTLAPTLGAALIILHAWPQTLVGRLLGSRLFVGVGLISYSAYLWHQPLFAFARYTAVETPSPALFALLCALTLALAALSWRYVEQPFRKSTSFDRKKIFSLAACGSAAFIALGVAGNLSDGFKFRFSNTNANIAPLADIMNVYEHYDYKNVVRNAVCHSVPFEALEKNGCIEIRSKKLLLWGDSYAAALYNGLRFIRDERHPEYGITQVTDGNGPPFQGSAKTDDGKTLTQANKGRLALAHSLQPDIVVLSWYISGQNSVNPKEAAVDALRLTIDQILQASPNSRVVVIGSSPQWNGTLQKAMLDYAREVGTMPPLYMSYGLQSKDSDWDAYFKEKLPGKNVSYISSHEFLCNSRGCLTRLSDDVTDITAVDFGHLTKNGSIYLARKIDRLIFSNDGF